MEQRVYHGQITCEDLARSLVAYFNRGNFRVQQMGGDAHIAVQIATASQASAGGQTAITVNLQQVEDGVAVQIGQQAWLGVAASLGKTALSVLMNPWNLLGRIDDLAQDVESFQITEDLWKVIDQTARALNSGHQISERLRRLECDFCGSANPVGESNCVACGAPLGGAQPVACRNCGFVVTGAFSTCPNCGKPL